MRGTIGIRLQNSNISNATRKTLVPFSTSSGFGGGGGDGRGGGRGRGGSFSGPPQFNFSEKPAPGNPNSNESKSDSTDSPIPPGGAGRGHGRGGTVPPPTGFPSFSSFMSSIQQPSIGRGRGFGPLPPQFENDRQQQQQQQQQNQQQPDNGPKKPVFFRREDNVSQTTRNDVSPPKKPVFTRTEDVKPIDLSGESESDKRFSMNVPSGVLFGSGRGKTAEKVDIEAPPVNVENRHIRARRTPGDDDATSENVPRRRVINDDGDGSGSGRGIGRESRGRGMYARGRGGRGRGGRGRGGYRGGPDDRTGRVQDTSHSYADGLFLGDNADGEKFAKRVGPELMNQVAEGVEEIFDRVLPSPLEDELLDAHDINFAIEFEPEYIMEFENPDIDEKEPISLRDALEKMKPFLMTYEGIRSQEEWEEVMEETMARAPLLKKIVDHYSGPDRVTAKRQQQELERVAKTLPPSAPYSVKEFTDRAVKSLQVCNCKFLSEA
ncbi:hydroxyproline-rich glycoprotein family protein [Trifolium pratense]|uniref:Hydroxyproline-rich glycoprotein family protein n=2 Tax=Trifolium pratense TaxID=57577 RepID=A0A2K3N101_TRIPR|nr:hydroxyproline-rich glycoprotein family protein [Trifolium pratense]